MSVERYAAARARVRLDEVSVGYRTVQLHSPSDLEAAQEGYGGDDWGADWLVVAYEDEAGDPIFTDLAGDGFPVYTAAHGEGSWDPVQIADTFDAFALALEEIASISSGREHPVGLEEHPLSDAELHAVLGRIRKANPNSDAGFWFWESWLRP